MQQPNKRLGELLVEGGLITPAQLQSAITHQKIARGRLGSNLRRTKVPDVEARSRQSLGNRIAMAHGTGNEPPGLLGVVIFVRAKPALKNVAITALQIENFESHITCYEG